MSMFSAIKLILTLKCEESTRLISQNFDADITRCEWMAVRMHALSCRSCRRFKKQILLLRDVLSQYSKSKALFASLKNITLPPEAKQRIQKALLSQLK